MFIAGDYAEGVVVADSLVYVADAEDGRHVIRFDGPLIAREDHELRIPRVFALDQNYPDPFNPSTTIAFDIPETPNEERPVILTVYDIRVRRVKQLVDSDLAPGNHKIHWNGQNDRGESVA